MVPCRWRSGKAGEQNAEFGRAGGGLLVATVTTLFFVPAVFSVAPPEPEAAPAETASAGQLPASA